MVAETDNVRTATDFRRMPQNKDKPEYGRLMQIGQTSGRTYTRGPADL